jgi:hypothetical protein
MSTDITENTYPKKSRTLRVVALSIVTVFVLGAIALGGTYLWQQRFGATQASAADCTLAQVIIDSTKSIPGDPAAGKKWEAATRAKIQNVKEDYLASQLRFYVGWAVTQATSTNRAGVEVSRNLSAEIPSHCDQKITVPPLHG